MTPSREGVRSEARAWIARTWEPDLTIGDWWDRLADAGWSAPTWPAHHGGRDLPGWSTAVVTEELDRVGAPGAAGGMGYTYGGPTIVDCGTPEQHGRYLRRIVTGRDYWCQLFSEPGAGSDLAGIETRAVRDGDEWVITGQKVWTTQAHQADLGMLLARTNPDAPKHRGITWFALPMRQGAVQVRPLLQMNGDAEFNEVFIDEARVPDANVVGAVDNGWKVALTTLAHERTSLNAHTAAVAWWGDSAAFRAERAGDVKESQARLRIHAIGHKDIPGARALIAAAHDTREKL